MYSKVVVLSIVVTLLSASRSVLATPAPAPAADLSAVEAFTFDRPVFSQPDNNLADTGLETRSLAPRAQRTCENQGKLRRNKFLCKGCDPKKSKGYKSSHNCKGKAYLCVEKGVGTCYSGGAVKKLNAEGGECFL